MSSSLIVSKKKPPTIPDFPGLPSTKKEAPIPPRYLEVKNASGKVETIEIKKKDEKGSYILPERTLEGSIVLQREREKILNAPMKLRAPDKASPLLVPTAYANAVQRQLEIQPHRFGVRVDSKSECKSEYPPKYVGSVARWGILNKKPAAPSVARPHFPTNPNDYYDSAFVGNRTTSGALLGHPQKRYIDPSRVPYLPPEDPPVGPDNPSKQLDAIWYAYWDEVASAVYYYNHETGEATWIAPTL